MNTEKCVSIFNACYPELRMNAAQFDRYVVKNARVLTEEENGETAGFALVHADRLCFLGVSPACRGKGHGKALLKRVENAVRDEGHTKIFLGTDRSNFLIGADKSTWDFFEKAGYRYGESCDEMLLELAGFDIAAHPCPVDPGVEFGWYEGGIEKLHAAVAAVDPSWVKYYVPGSRVFAATVGGEIASFCLVDTDVKNFLSPSHGRIGMPGCVGTVPKFRRRGIGLHMVAEVTEYLKTAGMDVSFIFYTEVAHWYEKLGYRTFLTECFGEKTLGI